MTVVITCSPLSGCVLAAPIFFNTLSSDLKPLTVSDKLRMAAKTVKLSVTLLSLFTLATEVEVEVVGRADD